MGVWEMESPHCQRNEGSWGGLTVEGATTGNGGAMTGFSWPVGRGSSGLIKRVSRILGSSLPPTGPRTLSAGIWETCWQKNAKINELG